jgi:hypothetical protein
LRCIEPEGSLQEEEEGEGGITLTLSGYHDVLAVKDEGEDTLAARRRSSILDGCARRDRAEVGNPAQDQFGDST